MDNHNFKKFGVKVAELLVVVYNYSPARAIQAIRLFKDDLRAIYAAEALNDYEYAVNKSAQFIVGYVAYRLSSEYANAMEELRKLLLKDGWEPALIARTIHFSRTILLKMGMKGYSAYEMFNVLNANDKAEAGANEVPYSDLN